MTYNALTPQECAQLSEAVNEVANVSQKEDLAALVLGQLFLLGHEALGHRVEHWSDAQFREFGTDDRRCI